MAYPGIKIGPYLLAHVIKPPFFLKRMQQILYGRMLRRGQRQLLRLELLPLQRFHLRRSPFDAIWNRIGHLLRTSHDEDPIFNKTGC